MPSHTALPAVWFPAIRTNTGTDVFTERLAAALQRAGLRAEISWLPIRAEYLPWSVAVPTPPPWANVVHVNSWLHRRLIARSRLPVVVTCHGCVHDPALEPYKSTIQRAYHRFWIKWLESRLYGQAKQITAVSAYTATRLTEVFGNIPVKVIPNWLPADAFDFRERDEPNHPFRLIYVGSLSRRKGADLLPEIMERLGPDFELWYTGEPSELPRALPNMHALGWSSDRTIVRNWLATSDALLFPSRMEGMPLAVLEAMACGLPVVSSDASSMPELIVHEESGIVCSSGVVDAFVRAAERLRSDVDLWHRMREAASRSARQHYCESPVISAYLDIYRAILRTNRERGARV